MSPFWQLYFWTGAYIAALAQFASIAKNPWWIKAIVGVMIVLAWPALLLWACVALRKEALQSKDTA